MMIRHEKQLLLHPFFLFSLLALLLNDHWLKYMCPGWITGKLSDFAGLLVFPVFWTFFFPMYKKYIYICTTLVFLWWKSPLSEGLIFFFNKNLHLPLQRVIDYSDLAALLMLPLAWRLKPAAINGENLLLRMTRNGVAAISLLACCATSVPARKMIRDDRYWLEGKHTKPLKVRKKTGEIVSILQEKGYQLRPHNDFFYTPVNNWYYVKDKDSSGNLVMKPLHKLYPAIYDRVAYGKPFTLDRLYIYRDSIQNIQLVISENNGWNGKTSQIRLVSFRHQATSDSASRFYEEHTYSRIAPQMKKKLRKLLRRK